MFLRAWSVSNYLKRIMLSEELNACGGPHTWIQTISSCEDSPMNLITQKIVVVSRNYRKNLEKQEKNKKKNKNQSIKFWSEAEGAARWILQGK